MLQGSDEWHELRRNKIGASDAPVIMGVSPWSSPQELWELKLGIRQPQEKKYHMERALALESAARHYFHMMTGYETRPAVYISPTYDWMMASLDGITDDEEVILEIKCPGKVDHDIAVQGFVPEKYYPQLQHQLAVMQLNVVYYLSFDGKDGIIIPIERDQAYIDKLIEKELEFYQCMQHFSPPSPSLKIESTQWSDTASLLISVQNKQKELQQQEIALKNALIGLSDGKNCEGGGIRLTKYIRKGSVDYERLLKDLGVDVNIDQYRKEDIESWKISLT